MSSPLARAAALVALIGLAAGCDLTVENPNASTPEDVLTTRAGLIAFANGLQRTYAVNALDNVVLTPGVTAREIAVNRTLANLTELEAGAFGEPMLEPDNSNVTGLFATLYAVVFDADQLIEAARAVETVEDDLESGLVALGSFYKAAALGALAQNFEQVSLDPGAEGGAVYVSRDDAFAEAVDLLAEAERLGQEAASDGAFQALVPDGFDLVNSARAYRARFALFGGDYATAIAAADAVDEGATSVFEYSDLAANPIYTAFYVGTPSYAVRDDLGLENVEEGDQRIDFYTDVDLGLETAPDSTDDDDTTLSNPNSLEIDVAAGFYDDGLSAPLPVFLPDELRLIRAEAIVRSGGDLSEAVEEINAVRTDEEDPFGVVAGLDAYDGPVTAEALLDEIFYNRATELFLQGLRLEDLRRFDRPGPSGDPFERTRDFYPYPTQERQGNPNTPTDPPI